MFEIKKIQHGGGGDDRPGIINFFFHVWLIRAGYEPTFIRELNGPGEKTNVEDVKLARYEYSVQS